jgi:serine/threonine protein kinase
MMDTLSPVNAPSQVAVINSALVWVHTDSGMLTQSTKTLVRRAAFGLEDFKVLNVLGAGASGTVYKVRLNRRSQELALKVVPKNNETCGGVEAILAEQAVLRKLAGNDCFLQLMASFHDSDNYYIATVRNTFVFMRKPQSLTCLLRIIILEAT